MARTKKEETEIVINDEASKNLLGSLLEEHKEDHFAFVKTNHTPVSTGSLSLDSIVRVESGQVIRLVGKGAELGKTSESFVLAENYMAVMPKSKTLYIKAEGRLSDNLQRRTGLKFVTKPADWDYGTVFIFPCNIFETVASMIETLVKSMHENGEHLCIILDSLDGLILRADSQKDVYNGESVKVAGVPLMTKLLFRRLALPINHYDAFLLVTGQYSAAIQLDPYSSSTPRQADSSGGSSISHQSDYVFEYLPRYNGDLICKNPDEKPDVVKNPIIGVYATLQIKKSGSDVSGTKIKIPIKKNVVGCAIWKSKEVADSILAFDLAKKAGAWISFSEYIINEAKTAGIALQEKFQGLPSLYAYLEANPPICDWFFNRIKKTISESDLVI